jgi:RNA polymerase sigma factor (sigma-70 family)
MLRVASPSVVRRIESLFDGGSVAGLSDRQLIERFTAQRDATGDAAFAALVARHGPMVLGVCRQLLCDRNDADDVFQAVFMVLARRAPSIHDPELLGNWLYGVALRTARKARRRLARTHNREQEIAARRQEVSSGAADVGPVVAREQAEALHDEIGRLPATLRLPVVLCYFEGLTINEAAARLRWPHGTVRSRLARARDRLRRGLTRRGMALSATALAASLATRPASASVSSTLCDTIAQVAIRFAAGQATVGVGSVSATSLARAVLRSSSLASLRFLAIGVLFLGGVAAGAGFVRPASAVQDRQDKASERRQLALPPDDVNPKPAPGRMFVTGRVLDPAGKPVQNAAVMVYASRKWPGRGDRIAQMLPYALGQAESDGSGRFRLDAQRSASSRHYQVGAVAMAAGYGAGWVELDPDAGQPAADITLRPEQPIHGRLFDVQGRPAQGVEVSVESMGTIVAGSPDTSLAEPEGPFFIEIQSGNLSAWPRPVKSDADGRFTIHGAGRNLRVGISIDHPRFARQRTHIDTVGSSEAKNVTMAVEPARIFSGRVTYADSGKPAPHALVDISIQGDDGSSFWAGDFETDSHGRFRANPGSGRRYFLSAFPPEREPYLNVEKRAEWPGGAIEHSIDLALPRGILVRGRVTEEGSGKPIAGARLGYVSNPDRDLQSGAWNSRAATAADGSFEFGVMPAPGYLTVLGPGEDYVLKDIGRHMARAGQPGGERMYAHAFHLLDLKPGSASLEVAVTLRPSAVATARVVGPDGQPVRDALVISRAILRPLPIAWLYWTAAYRDSVKDGHIAVHGLSDDTEVPVYFLDSRHDLGATAYFWGKSALSGPVTVRLEACGRARARLVNPAGKPVARLREAYTSYKCMMIVTPGPHPSSQAEVDRKNLAADQGSVVEIDPAHYPKGLVSDDQGQLALPSLIPGATYRVYDNTVGGGDNPQLRKEFTVKPGETVDLGDLLIERPGP